MASQPLAGLRVISLALNVPGPVAASRLRALGAEVHKIEPPGGDPLQAAAPAWYACLSEGQQVRRLNLKAPDQRQIFNNLLAQSDLLLSSTRPEALRRLGLVWNSLHTTYPRLCQVAIVGYPAPDENLPGHDLTYQAACGLVQPPGMPRTLIADLAGAEQAVSAALALLLERERRGVSGYAQVSLAQAAQDFAAPALHGLTTAGGVFGGGQACYRLYAAREGWIALAALEPHFWVSLLQALGLEPERGSVQDLELAISAQTAEYWESWAQERDLPILRVVTTLLFTDSKSTSNREY